MMNKTSALLMSVLSISFMTPALAQNFESGASANMVTRQTIHSDANGSTTITTIIEPSARSTAAASASSINRTPVTNTPPATPFLAPTANPQPTELDHEVVTHYHFGSQKSDQSMPTQTHQVTSTSPAPTVRYENVREDPEDVMMRILNQKK